MSEVIEKLETLKSSGGKPVSKMTLQRAIELGEYDPEFLSTFPEWHTLSPHVQLQFIRNGLDNRERQLVVQWSEINNVLDFRLKPQMREALRNIERQLDKVHTDREHLYLEYSKK